LDFAKTLAFLPDIYIKEMFMKGNNNLKNLSFGTGGEEGMVKT
jgi:hypothetical protein